MLDILWVPALFIATFGLFIIVVEGRWRLGYGLLLAVIAMLCLVIGWQIHGGITSYQKDLYYQSGEANGYNRGLRDGQMINIGQYQKDTEANIDTFKLEWEGYILPNSGGLQ